MTLTIEDGTNVANANSYVTLTDTRAYALARGITLSTVDATLETQILKSMDYFESFRERFKGNKKYEDQCLQFPRTSLYIDGIVQSSTSIPKEVKFSLYQLVMEIHSGIDINPNFTGNFVKKEKVDVIETEYDNAQGNMQPSLTKVNFTMKPLLKSNYTVTRI